MRFPLPGVKITPEMLQFEAQRSAIKKSDPGNAQKYCAYLLGVISANNIKLDPETKKIIKSITEELFYPIVEIDLENLK